MNLTALLQQCTERGIRLTLVDGSVKVNAPKGTLTPELVNLLREHKETLQQELAMRFAASTSKSVATQQHDVLSFNQHRLWFIDYLGGGSNYLNLPASFLLQGPCNVRALKQALRQIVERHQVLRTVYSLDNGEPKPRLLSSGDLQIPETDLSSYSDYKERLLALIDEDSDLPFSLADDFMLRCHIYHMGPDEHVLQLNMHHIASDGWSQRVLMQELSALYWDYSRGNVPSLPPLKRQYADFAAWQREYLSGEILDAHLNYWRGALDGAPVTHSIPLDRPRTPEKKYPGDVHYVQLEKGLSQRLYQLARDNGVTLFMVLETAFSVLIGRLGNCRDVVIGSPISNRNQADYTSVIGFFVNTLVLRTRWEEGASFLQVLAENKAHLLEAYEYQSVPYELLLDSLKVERSLSYNALFQIMFVLQEKLEQQGDFTDLDMQMLPQKRGTSQFEIIMTAVEQDEGLGFSWRYDTDLFSRGTIASFADALVQLITAIAATPSQPIESLPLIKPQNILPLSEPGGSLEESRAVTNICATIDQFSDQNPSKVAVVNDDNVLTYEQLSNRSNQLAHQLAEQGVNRGQVVAICLPRSVEMSVAILAVLRLGAAYLPIDTQFPTSRQQFMLEDSGAVALIANESQYHTAIPVVSVTCGDELHVSERLVVEVAENDLAYLNYTSGTTGQPKGVMVSHGNLANYCSAAQQYYRIDQNDKVMQASAFSFDACVEEHFMALIHGATLVYRDDICLADWGQFTQFVNRFGITVAGLPTAVWNGLCDDIASLKQAEHGALRLLILGGEALKGERLERWKYAIGEDIQLLNTYGPTETTIITTAYDTASWQPGSPVPIGRLISGAKGYILDKCDNPVPQGAVGELCIGGLGVAKGYLNRPDESAFGKFDIESGVTERIYRTGDMVRLGADGELTYIGRRDQQLKVRGYRIEPEEIETQLCLHPEVSQAVVIPYQPAADQTVLVAFVTLTADQSQLVNETLLREFLRDQLPDYMVPSQILAIDAIPLTVNGKLDRARLPTADLNRLPDNTFVDPETDTEKTLASIWLSLLKLDKVSVLSNFFELGGHSLLGIKLIAALKTQFDITMTIRELFEAQTIRKLAGLIDKRETPSGSGALINLAEEVSAIELPASIPSREIVDSQYQHLVSHFGSGDVDGILLTGATGYIGAFLLEQLLAEHHDATIYCLVRAGQATEGLARIKANLEQYGIWRAENEARIKAVPADLSLPDLGLASEVWDKLASDTQWIIHNGAQVNHVLPYQALKASNVDGTEALLRLSVDTGLKLFSFISATAVFGAPSSSRTITEFTSIDSEQHPSDAGYAGSKWVAEKLVMRAREQGLPCHIFRLGRIGAHSKTAVCTPDDIPGRYLRTCLALGRYPDTETYELMVPVDTACQTIVKLSLAELEHPGNFHLVGKYGSGWNAMLSASEKTLQPCSLEEWIGLIEASLSTEQPLPMAPYLLLLQQMEHWRKRDKDDGNTAPSQRFCQLETERLMGGVGLGYPRPTRDHHAAYLAQLQHHTS